jgi:hypothetical protein
MNSETKRTEPAPVDVNVTKPRQRTSGADQYLRAMMEASRYEEVDWDGVANVLKTSSTW